MNTSAMASPYGGQAPIAPPIVKQPVFTVVIWTGTSIATIALVFRYYVRIKTFRRLLLDDYLTGLAWTILLATAITWQVIMVDFYELMEVTAGIRMPSMNFVSNAERNMKGTLAVLFLFYVGLWTVKMSFLAFFYRLGDQVTYYRASWWTVTIVTAAAGISCLGTIQYHCLADPLVEVSKKCLGGEAIRFQDVTLKVNCALDVVTDTLIMMLPISILWNVRISMSRRLALGGVFSLAVITMAIAIVRVTVTTDSRNISRNNKQVESTWLYTWHFVESAVAIIIACVASFRTLFTTKERSREARAALQRDRELNGSPGVVNLRVLKARARHFQDSLFSTVKSADGDIERFQSATESVSRKDSHMEDSMSQEERNLSDVAHPLNVHELITVKEAHN